MPQFDFFIALDGFGLNGFEGLAGVARLRAAPESNDYQIDVKYFSGLSGGHATQVSPGGKRAYLGNLSQLLLFYDPRTLEETARVSTLRWAAPDVPYSSQTHVVWLDDDSFITVLGKHFWRFEMNNLSAPERLGEHGVTLPHAIKRSPSGRYLFYGAMDHDAHGYANEVGIFDLEAGTARIVKLPATVWHLGVHPDKDVFYAPTQRCAPQNGSEFAEYTIAHFKNYLFEIDGPRAEVLRHLAIPKDMPGSLTSDVVVTRDRVLYNACASSAIAVVDLDGFDRVRYIDERVTGWQALRHARAGFANLVEALSRANLPDHTHDFFKAIRIARGSTLDGSYGLGLSPCGRFLLSAHRGLNQVLVYDYPSLELRRAIDFPPAQRFFPKRLGPLDDPRLGFHHSTISALSAT
ncbi:MAG: hypothetical protein R3B13_36690 [Polyangiaceae bacterium]